MDQILRRRQSLHRNLETQQNINRQLNTQLNQAQTLANMGVVCSMIAHEMNNILTPLGSFAQLALQNPDDRQLTHKALTKTIENTRKASQILDSILAMAAGRKQDLRDWPIAQMVDEVFTCLARDFAKDRIKIEISIAADLQATADGASLQQVLMNLILNAREAMLPRGGVLTIDAHPQDDIIVIHVKDSGCGISADDLPRIFDPFFTTKNAQSQTQRTGAGLGLAFCKRVIEAHNGSISVDSKQGGPTQFTIRLPRK